MPAADDPNHLGSGIGALLADTLPFMPSGLRRTGAARLMAERIGESPGWTTRNPVLSQLLGVALGGGAYWATGNKVLGVAPLAAVQLDKGLDIRRIQRAYEAQKKRKRLREIAVDQLRKEMGGSQELGMAAAYEQMRNRKFELGPMSEAADAGMVFAYPASLVAGPAGGAASMTLAGSLADLIDGRAAKSLAKEGSMLEPSSSPVILTALASLLGAYHLNGYASKKFHEDLHSGNDRSLERNKWEPLIKSISGVTPLTAHGRKGGNAFHTSTGGSPLSDRDIAGILDQHGSPGSDMDEFFLKKKENRKAVGGEWALARLTAAHDEDELYSRVRGAQARQFRRAGLVRADGPYAVPKVLAHEAGHAKIEQTPGLVRWLQRNLYGSGRDAMLLPIGAIGSTAAGLATANPLLGALAGAGIGTVVHAGTVVPELMASYHGLKGLQSFEGGRHAKPGDAKSLAKAYATYLSTTLAPHMLAGGAAGMIGMLRKKKKKRKLDSDDGTLA